MTVEMDAESFERFAGPFPEAMFLVSADGIVLAGNARAVALCGRPLPELCGVELCALVAEPREKVEQYLGSCARSRGFVMGALAFLGAGGEAHGYRVDGALVRPRADGAPALVLLQCRPRREVMGQFSALNERIAMLSREIGERRRAEAELHAQREWLRITLSSIGDAVIAADREGRVTFVNPVAESLIGWPQEEAAGRSFAEVFRILHEETRAPVEDPVARVLRDGKAVALANHTVLLSRDGSERPIEDSAAPILDDRGRVVGVVLVFRDVSKRREEERRREELLTREKEVREQAEAANRVKDEFLAMLSHELRTPMSAITGWLQLLREPDLPAEQASYGLEVIERNVRAQTQLINDLLDVSRVMSGKLVLDVKPVNVHAVIEAALESVRLAAVVKGISVRSAAPSEGCVVQGDADRLQQVIWNVLQNAIKFTPVGGSVEIGVRRGASFVEISVADSGVGIAPQFLPHLFERFRQADSAITRRYGGLGLGLTIVRQLVELHGGTVRADSPGEGRGTTITIRLPRKEASQSAAARGAPGLASAEGASGGVRRTLGGVRVLLVDDDDDSREILRIMLQRYGAEVVEARSAKDALDQLQLHVPDVLISDISMPGEDGYSLLRRLRALPEAEGGRVPALALTALARKEDHLRALREGFLLHLTKPIAPAELAAAVAGLLGRGPVDRVQ